MKLPPKQVLQKLPILLAQVRVNNTSENLLNKNQQIYYSLYLAKEISKKCIYEFHTDYYINHQHRYKFKKFTIELHFKLKLSTNLKF